MKHIYIILSFALLLGACGKEEAATLSSEPVKEAAARQEQGTPSDPQKAEENKQNAAAAPAEPAKPQSSTPPASGKLIEKYKEQGYQVEEKHVFTHSFEGIGELTVTPVTKFGFQQEFPMALIVTGGGKEQVLTPKREDGHAMFSSFEAISFKDIDEPSGKPGLTDIIVIANFITGAGKEGAVPFSEVFIFKNDGKGGFVEDAALAQRIRASTDSRTLTMKQVLELAKPIDLQRFIGSFKEVSSSEYNGAEINIKSVTKDKLTFSLDAFHVNGGAKGLLNGNVNVGQIEEGTAKLEGHIATFRDDATNFTLTFTFYSNDTFQITEQGGPYFGMNVTASGLYKRLKK